LCVDLEFIDPDNANPISVDPDNFIFAMRCNLYIMNVYIKPGQKESIWVIVKSIQPLRVVLL